ncbi:hypothetical protein DL95DRAFT_87796 [Leptodontidium sp. 2 PMI_412]|nr:hypothetical protein DL95DRAFT_87796 [Leptodontidium sp. 2 PMI_412]
MLFRYVLSLDLIDLRFPTRRISPVPHYYMLSLLLCGLLGFIPPTVVMSLRLYIDILLLHT